MNCRTIALAACAAVGLVAAGCQRAEIESYEAPKPMLIGPGPSASAGEATRMLAAMFPRGDSVWYFRLTGPVEAVEEQENAFDRFLASLKFKGEDASWDTPPGWKQEGGKTEFRYATLRNGPMELRMSRLRNEGQAAVVLPNINRWRGELGLPPWRDSDLKEQSKTVTADGMDGVRVAFSGRGGGGMARTPPMTDVKAPAPTPGSAGPIKYAVPPSWQDLGPRAGFVPSLATFRTPGGDLTVTALGGDGGGLAPNVNRWREQVGLNKLGDAEVLASLKPVEIDGRQGHLVDLAGTGGKRTLGAIVAQGGKTWFFKVTGPSDSLGSQMANFEAFLKSVRFTGGGR